MPFHLQQKAQGHVPHKNMLAKVAENTRNIFNAPDRVTAEAYLVGPVAKYQHCQHPLKHSQLEPILGNGRGRSCTMDTDLAGPDRMFPSR